MIVFGLFEIVLIVLRGFVGSCYSVSFVVFPLPIDCVLRVLVVHLFCFVGTGI